MKPYFKGDKEPPRHRICTCQKCIRTGDIENIGKTARHGTYFEMLGNFSFGDYFKHEAIAWSWEFLTSPEWVGLDPERLYPSVYEKDDEAFNIWRDEIGIPERRITRLGKEDNFWEHGSGPCGPCSEIYFDRGEEYGCGKPDCAPGCDCDRYMEVWNNVFSQFDNDGNGNYSDLIQKNIDTGMGLERLAVVCQGVDSLFDVDTVMNITHKVSEITGAHYGDSHKTDVSLRVNGKKRPPTAKLASLPAGALLEAIYSCTPLVPTDGSLREKLDRARHTGTGQLQRLQLCVARELELLVPAAVCYDWLGVLQASCYPFLVSLTLHSRRRGKNAS